MTENSNNIKKFPINILNEDWPFSENLALNLFHFNRAQSYSSLKQYFIINLLDEDDYDYNEDTNEYDIHDTEYGFLHKNFFFRNNKLFFANPKNEIYFVESIPYNDIVCAAVRYTLKQKLKQHDSKKELIIRIWKEMFYYLIETSFSIPQMLEKHNYKLNHKENIIEGFLYGLKQLKYNDFLLDELFSKNKVKLFKERLFKVFIFSEMPKKDAEMLTEDYFLTRDLDEIILYYEKMVEV